MSLLVVGSIALDSVFTPFGETADALLRKPVEPAELKEILVRYLTPT